MLAVSQHSGHRPSYRLPWRVHRRLGQPSLEHFARFCIVQQIAHRGCIEGSRFGDPLHYRASQLKCFDDKLRLYIIRDKPVETSSDVDQMRNPGGAARPQRRIPTSAELLRFPRLLPFPGELAWQGHQPGRSLLMNFDSLARRSVPVLKASISSRCLSSTSFRS
jgi:hypothetical protein